MPEAARLGNLMFGYASLLGIARRNNFTPVLGLQQSNTNYLLDAFQLRGLIRKRLNTSVWRRVGEAMASAYDPQTEQIGLGDEPAGVAPRDGDRFGAFARDEFSNVGGSFRKGLKALEDYFSSRLGWRNRSVGLEAEKDNVADTDERSMRTKHLVNMAATPIADDVVDVGPLMRDDVADDGVPKPDDVVYVSESPMRDDVADDGVPKPDDVADVSESPTGDDVADDVVLDGYFQSWRYFADVRDEVLRLFTFKARYRQIASKFLNKAIDVYYPPSNISDLLRTSHSSPREVQSADDAPSGGKTAKSASSEVVTVGIHVRRGDMTGQGAREQGYVTAPAAYVAVAMAYMEERLAARNVLYVVCSDDPGWFQQEVKLNGTLSGRPIVYCPGEESSAAQDMAVLAACDHTIMTVGSYGWWAGYLAGGTTVYYSRCLEEGSLVARGFRAEDYFPPEWVGLTGER